MRWAKRGGLQAHTPFLSAPVATAPGCRYHNALLTIRGDKGANRHRGYLTEPSRPDPWNSIELVMQVSELNGFLRPRKVSVAIWKGTSGSGGPHDLGWCAPPCRSGRKPSGARPVGVRRGLPECCRVAGLGKGLALCHGDTTHHAGPMGPRVMGSPSGRGSTCLGSAEIRCWPAPGSGRSGTP